MLFPTPFGDMALVLNPSSVVVRAFLPNEWRAVKKRAIRVADVRELRDLLARFFRGEPVSFPLEWMDLQACRGFQRNVLIAQHAIPMGRVTTYGRIAKALGNPLAARAVGRALATNPFPILIPCHRTVRESGELSGFGGGLAMKRALLEMEGVEFDSNGRVLREFFL